MEWTCVENVPPLDIYIEDRSTLHHLTRSTRKHGVTETRRDNGLNGGCGKTIEGDEVSNIGSEGNEAESEGEEG